MEPPIHQVSMAYLQALSQDLQLLMDRCITGISIKMSNHNEKVMLKEQFKPKWNFAFTFSIVIDLKKYQEFELKTIWIVLIMCGHSLSVVLPVSKKNNHIAN